MRTVIHALAIIAAVLAAQSALGQASPAAVPVKTEEPSKPDPLGVARARIRELEQRLADQAKLDRQRFDLDFPGGGPKALVAAIEKATGKPLNAIVPSEEQIVQIPPMKLTNVRVEELFLALKLASTNRVYGFNSITESSYGFENRGVGENPIWCFHSRRPLAEPDVCRYFQLAGYLDNFTIEDITTAIQTGWDLLGVQPKPRLKFHPETKLLIAVGDSHQVGGIEDVLVQLRHGMAEHAAPVRTGPTPGPAPKKDGGSTH